MGGVGFTVDCRWVLPNRSCIPIGHFHQSQQQQPYSAKGPEASLNTTRVSSLYSVCEGSETAQNQMLKTYNYSFRTLTNLSRYSSKINEFDVHTNLQTVPPRLLMALENMLTEDTSCSSKDDFVQFTLLMENVNKIEDILVDSDLVRLERDIMLQVGRLGASNLFQTCLSRTFMKSDALDSNFPVTEHSGVSNIIPSETNWNDNVIVQSRKKEFRKLKRKRALEKAADMFVKASPSISDNELQTSPASSATYMDRPDRPAHSRHLSRILIARNESKFSDGVKELASLERLRLTLEEKDGKSASFARWAKAASIDEKTLQNRLLFGWRCRDALLKSTRSLVVYIAKGYSGMGMGFEDLIQAGKIGVLLGAERFDSSRGYRFSTYVQYWIKKSISSLIACHSRGIRLPVRMEKIIKQIQKARRSISSSKGKYPQDEELAEFTGLSLSNVRLANNCSRPSKSIEQTLNGGLNFKFSEITPDGSIETPEESVMREHMKNDIHRVLGALHPRERQVLLLRYGLEDGRSRSLSEIGNLGNVSKEWIRKIEKSAFAKLRKKEIQGLLNYSVKH